MTDLEISGLVVIIIALCEAIKRAGVSTRYIPLIAIVIGVAGTFYFGGTSWMMAFAGVVVSLTAQGLFSGIKKTVFNK